MLGHVSHAILYQDPERNRSHPRELLLDDVLKGEIDRLHESLYHEFNQTRHLYLAWSHLVLLSSQLPGFSNYTASQASDTAHAIIVQLSSSTSDLRPLNHHFAGLAAITLAEDMDKDKSVASLQQLRGVLDTGYIREDIESGNSRPHKTIWNAPISSFIAKKLGDSDAQTVNEPGSSHGGLQHLADAAVGNGPSEEGTDWTAGGAKGFLNVFE